MTPPDSIDRRAIAAWLCAALLPFHYRIVPGESEAARSLRWADCARDARMLTDRLIAELEAAPFPAGVPVTNPRWQDPPF